MIAEDEDKLGMKIPGEHSLKEIVLTNQKLNNSDNESQYSKRYCREINDSIESTK